MEQNEKKIDSNTWWKIVAFLVMGILIGIFFGMKVLSAIELNLNKTQTCQLLNYSGDACNSFWCVSGLKGNWTADEICVINGTYVNVTNITNQTAIFNETEVRRISRNETLLVVDEKKLINETQLITTKNAILDVRDNDTENVVRRVVSELNLDGKSSREPIPTFVIIVIVIVLGGVILGVSYFNSKKKEKSEAEIYEEQPSYSPKGPYKPKQVKAPPTKEEIKKYEQTGEPPEAEDDEEEVNE
jgi:uncharacterized protein YneF (UPF0154 family)